MAVYHRPQLGREGFAVLLLRKGKGVGFARVHPDRERVKREFTVLELLHAAQPRSFAVARPVAFGESEPAAWMLTESVPNYPLGAVRRESTRQAVAAELSQVLNGRLDRPAGTPSHWVPAHGDFAPWNLRTELGGKVRVIDWEDATYAPPGVDLLYGSLTAHATFGSRLLSSTTVEAARWIDELLQKRSLSETGARTETEDLRALLRLIPKQ